MSDWTDEEFERLSATLQAIPADVLRALRDLPECISVDECREVRRRLRASSAPEDPQAVDLRIDLLMAVRGYGIAREQGFRFDTDVVAVP